MSYKSKNLSWKVSFSNFIYVCLFFSCSLSAKDFDMTSLEQQVREAEIAFAKSMEDRDFAKFKSFISEEAIFLTIETPSRGKDEVVAVWKQFFETDSAPFSWKPETVVVLKSGKIALSTGPVFDPAGQLTAYFTSTWRQEKPGLWKIIFDKGNKACDADN